MSEVKETMEDFASELEASYKEYDARRNNAYQDQESLHNRWKTRPF